MPLTVQLISLLIDGESFCYSDASCTANHYVCRFQVFGNDDVDDDDDNDQEEDNANDDDDDDGSMTISHVQEVVAVVISNSRISCTTNTWLSEAGVSSSLPLRHHLRGHLRTRSCCQPVSLIAGSADRSLVRGQEIRPLSPHPSLLLHPPVSPSSLSPLLLPSSRLNPFRRPPPQILLTGCYEHNF
eukprot:763418-Hanusia_phi.AAC.16